MPVVSVIIPTYKHSDFVLATLDSVFAQTFTDYEIIVVNDGSPDDTARVLRSLVDSGRIHYIEQENQGQAAARNRGIAEAQGKYIAFLDDDDLWPPDKLEWQTEVLRSQPKAVLVYGFAESFGDVSGLIFPGENAPQGDVYDKFLELCWLSSPGQSLISVDALKVAGLLDPEIRDADDWDIYLRLAKQGDFVYRHRRALYYRKHGQNASKNVWRMYVNTSRLMEKHIGRPTRKNAHQWRTYRRQTVNYLVMENVGIARQQFETGQRSLARRTLWETVRIQPNFIRRRLFVLTLIKSLVLDCLARFSGTAAR